MAYRLEAAGHNFNFGSIKPKAISPEPVKKALGDTISLNARVAARDAFIDGISHTERPIARWSDLLGKRRSDAEKQRIIEEKKQKVAGGALIKVGEALMADMVAKQRIQDMVLKNAKKSMFGDTATDYGELTSNLRATLAQRAKEVQPIAASPITPIAPIKQPSFFTRVKDTFVSRFFGGNRASVPAR